MDVKVSVPEKIMSWRILISLIFARLSARPYFILVSILLVDIANSFQVPVGVISQIRSLSSIVTIGFLHNARTHPALLASLYYVDIPLQH